MNNIYQNYYEFDLVVRKKGPVEKQNSYDYSPINRREEEPEIIVKEELKFNTLDVGECMRKLIDYIRVNEGGI